ncbi:MAG: SPOR domain-containing protein [Oxalobacteraceae bacterium]|jgi:DedD protein|nr:SPOR domain-containing protein [Oxalobacteraceae bacterium]
MGLFSGLGKGKQDVDDDVGVPVRPRRRASKAQDEEPIDPMLPEKKRARRRLIGASALVLAAIIGLPMIFDSEPKPLTDDIAIQIPSRDKQGAGTVITALPEQPVEAKKSQPSSNTAAEVKSDASQSTVVAQVPTEKATVASNLQPAPEKPVQKSADNSTPANEKAAATRFVLQVAAVANKSKADELQTKLKQAGIKTYLQKISTKDGERYRVRVGPFGNRDEAEKMRSRIMKMGLTVVVQSV